VLFSLHTSAGEKYPLKSNLRHAFPLVVGCCKRIITGSRGCDLMSDSDIDIDMREADLKLARMGSKRSRDHDSVDDTPNKSPRTPDNTRTYGQQASQRPDEDDRMSLDPASPPWGTPEAGRRLGEHFELDDSVLPSSPLPSSTLLSHLPAQHSAVVPSAGINPHHGLHDMSSLYSRKTSCEPVTPPLMPSSSGHSYKFGSGGSYETVVPDLRHPSPGPMATAASTSIQRSVSQPSSTVLVSSNHDVRCSFSSLTVTSGS